MKNKKISIAGICILFAFFWRVQVVCAREFVHPGGLHTRADLERMKKMVAEGRQPWLEGWKELEKDPLAQYTFKPSPMANMGVSRQKASIDAHAAYLNAIRWYVSGDKAYAKCAIKICNAWSDAVNQVPVARQDLGLVGIPISEFAMAAEVLRVCDLWKKKDFERFKSMMLEYLYPVSRDFLKNHGGTNVDYCWTNWDACNMVALLAIGVLCDRKDIYDEGVAYYKYGLGNGSIGNAVPFLHRLDDGTVLGQWQESGRDQAHAQLGVGFLGNVCQIAWNQGDDLFGYDRNRLLAGAEYVARHNQMRGVPFTYYNNSQEMHNRWPAINALGVLGERPVWELIYNHYEVLKGVPAPYCKRMAELLRPEHGSKDHFGYGTLTFTLQPSVYPPLPVPAVPEGLKADASIGKVFLEWKPAAGFTANGYVIQRSEAGKNDFKDIAVYEEKVLNCYTDFRVETGKRYDYRVAALNKTGRSSFSSYVQACSFVLAGVHTSFAGERDNGPYIYKEVEGDFVWVARLHGRRGPVSEAGLMVRAALDETAESVTMTLGHAGGRFARMGSRKQAGTERRFAAGNAYTWLPAWFKLTRVGDVFYAYESPDGVNWFYIHSVRIKMPQRIYAGLTVCCQEGEKPGQAEFDHVELR